jgi:molybdenum cofactor cytidylyltransferase
MNRHLNLILMAAGNSQRFGANKLLADIQGQPMYRPVFDHLARYQQDHPGCCQVTVVSQYDVILDAAKAAGLVAVRNPRPEDGISLTIRLGLEAGIRPQPAPTATGLELDLEPRQGAVFFTADQPFLRYETLQAFLEQAQANPGGLLAACHKGVSGNPVCFDQVYYPELLALQGDSGGKRVMNSHLDDVTWFEMDAEELVDIDRPLAQAEG